MQNHLKRIQPLLLATLTTVLVMSASAQAHVIVVNAADPRTVPHQLVKPGDRLIVNFVERKYSKPADKDRNFDPNTYYVWDDWQFDKRLPSFLRLNARRAWTPFPWLEGGSASLERTVTFDLTVDGPTERRYEDNAFSSPEKLTFINNSFTTKVLLPEGTSRGPEHFDLDLQLINKSSIN